MRFSGVVEIMLTWVYYEHPDNNLFTAVNQKLFINHLGYNSGQMLYTWVKIWFWWAVCWYLYERKIFFKI